MSDPNNAAGARGCAFITGLIVATAGACFIFGWGPSLLTGGMALCLLALIEEGVHQVKKRKKP